jgi:hypothetical protein
MNRYGQAITWSTIGAPHPFSGVINSYSYRDATTQQNFDDEGGDFEAMALHSQKAALNFDAEVRSTSTNFLDLSAGAALTVSGIGSGVILATRAVETWRLGQAKTFSLEATHYPDMVQVSPVAAGTDLDAFTPDQAALGIVAPGGVVIYSTFGLEHTSGVVHALSIEQILGIDEDDPSPDGKLLGAASNGYMRKISLSILAKAAAPALKSTLAITNAPDHGADYRIEEVETRWVKKRGKMYDIRAVWIPPFTT